MTSGKIAPSILSADFAELAAEVERVTPEADLLHVDVMDGHFVPNLTIGPPVVKSLRKRTDLHLDCHLMVDNPGELIEDFAEAGADGCTIHIELGDPRPTFARMRDLGLRVGLTLNPETPVESVLPYLEEVDILLFMSVHPGFGGQAFIPSVLDKLAVVRGAVDATTPSPPPGGFGTPRGRPGPDRQPWRPCRRRCSRSRTASPPGRVRTGRGPRSWRVCATRRTRSSTTV